MSQGYNASELMTLDKIEDDPINLSNTHLTEMCAIANKATKGHWSYGQDWGDLGAIVSVGDAVEFVYGGPKLGRPFSKVPPKEQDANARYIATFGPKTSLAMIKEIKRLRAKLKE